MKTRPPYRSSIPATAQPQVVHRYASGEVARIDYLVNGAVVGYRDFEKDGTLSMDCGLRNGRQHGTSYRIENHGRELVSATPYRNGLEHGIARQWGENGRLIGWYRMHHGTGIDLWWNEESWEEHPPRRKWVSEVFQMEKGARHGYEWWVNDDQTSVWLEAHYQDSAEHGIRREWGRKGRLSRGFPKYYVRDEQVTRRQYDRACRTDPTLPPYRREDNRPQRKFPAAVARRLTRR